MSGIFARAAGCGRSVDEQTNSEQRVDRRSLVDTLRAQYNW
jgi:hypothetical protein